MAVTSTHPRGGLVLFVARGIQTSRGTVTERLVGVLGDTLVGFLGGPRCHFADLVARGVGVVPANDQSTVPITSVAATRCR